MRVIVAGSRDVTDPALVAAAIAQSGFPVTTLISGGARGVDRMGETWARARGIAVEIYRAAWQEYGRAAGMMRNAEMAGMADALVAVWNGVSPGTAHTIETAEKLGLKFYVLRTDLMTKLPPPPPPHLAHLANRVPPPIMVPPPPIMVPPPPPPPAPAAPVPLVMGLQSAPRVRVTCDTECYVDYWLASFMDVKTRQVIGEFETYPGQPLDIDGLARMLHTTTIVTFNGKHYDDPMIAAALLGYDCGQLKWLSDRIIQGNLKPWDIERDYKIRIPHFIDHIDLKEIMPGGHGLKMYMGKMGSRMIQELPIEHNAHICSNEPIEVDGRVITDPAEKRAALRLYCRNDLSGTVDAYELFSEAIATREEMTVDYGVDLRSKSDAQISEAVIKHEVAKAGVTIEKKDWATGTYFYFDAPAYLEYQTPILRELLDMVRRAKFFLGTSGVDMPPELDSAKIKIGSSVYRLGIGGLHSSEAGVFHVSDEHNVLLDIDVDGYYPSLMLNSGYWPEKIGPQFIPIFRNIKDTRMVYKRAGKTSKSNTLKIVVNGGFGKTLSVFGPLSSPKFGIQTTVSGQLSLLMLIETLELCGIPVVSANTDGIVTKAPRALAWLRDQIVQAWQTRTGLTTEAVQYDAIYFQSVNSYVAFKTPTEKDPKPKPKLKGEFAPPVPVASSWPSPSGMVCVDAVVAYLKDKTPIEQTIRACRDIKRFVYIQNVRMGAVKYYGDDVEAATRLDGQRFHLAQAGFVEVDKKVFMHATLCPQPSEMKVAYKIALNYLRDTNPVRKEYLGKVVRWYYAKDMPGAIRNKVSRNLIPKTEGAKPCMILPAEFPDDINYDWYVREAKSLVTDLGVPMV